MRSANVYVNEGAPEKMMLILSQRKNGQTLEYSEVEKIINDFKNSEQVSSAKEDSSRSGLPSERDTRDLSSYRGSKNNTQSDKGPLGIGTSAQELKETLDVFKKYLAK